MRPVMISPCSVCGWTLTHDHDPRVVLCAGCERDKFLDANPHLAPPPTTEQRGKRVPPPPPPMRRPHQDATLEVVKVYVVFGLAVAFGILIGVFLTAKAIPA